ncbi:MAG TPA: hypothetical protein VE988_29160 [Gemmataceae bacterium]|nr:hypothetical protein [Gemmataceae bacterium]
MIIFASLVIERPPLDWSGLLSAIAQWLQDAGVYAFIWLLLVGLSYAVVPEFRQRSPWGKLHTSMMTLGIIAAVFLVIFGILVSVQRYVPETNVLRPADRRRANDPPPEVYTKSQKWAFSLAGLAALTACVLPICRDLAQKRIIARRIWAIARVAIKEAWSRGIVWVCLIIPLIYLYADQFISTRLDDQLRNRVGIAYFSMSILFILSAGLLGAFSIPADLKNQNMFTIVTKPVERYEIVLGRFLGYALLLFAEVLLLTCVSYVYVVRGLTEQAREESYHARVPLYGSELYYFNTSKGPGRQKEGENVGREWNYRSYISGPDPQASNPRVQYAVWEFDELPAALVDRDDMELIRLEYAFDVFRTTKGLEDKGVNCSFTFARGELSPEQVENLLKPTGVLSQEKKREFDAASARIKATGKQGEELDQLNAQAKKEIDWKLFEKHGVYRIEAVSVYDYHTQVLEIPAKIFKTLQKSGEARKSTPDSDRPPLMQIFVNVENDWSSRFQRVGMSKADLYLLVDDRPFWLNFFKGSLCIYLIACVVLGLAVVCSTYLTGIVSLLMTALLCISGMFLPFIKSLSEGRNDGGGPFEAMYRVAHNQSANIPLDLQSATIDAMLKGDAIYRWWLRFIMHLLPDVGQFYPNEYVGNGFDITWGTLLLLNHILPVVAYLTPWLLLSYYLMKSREIANP